MRWGKGQKEREGKKRLRYLPRSRKGGVIGRVEASVKVSKRNK